MFLYDARPALAFCFCLLAGACVGSDLAMVEEAYMQIARRRVGSSLGRHSAMVAASALSGCSANAAPDVQWLMACIARTKEMPARCSAIVLAWSKLIRASMPE
jgi:hypothetical protein